jgi:hypothetical protein
VVRPDPVDQNPSRQWVIRRCESAYGAGPGVFSCTKPCQSTRVRGRGHPMGSESARLESRTKTHTRLVPSTPQESGPLP